MNKKNIFFFFLIFYVFFYFFAKYNNTGFLKVFENFKKFVKIFNVLVPPKKGSFGKKIIIKNYFIL